MYPCWSEVKVSYIAWKAVCFKHCRLPSNSLRLQKQKSSQTRICIAKFFIQQKTRSLQKSNPIHKAPPKHISTQHLSLPSQPKPGSAPQPCNKSPLPIHTTSTNIPSSATAALPLTTTTAPVAASPANSPSSNMTPSTAAGTKAGAAKLPPSNRATTGPVPMMANVQEPGDDSKTR
jgi:hypothetical protein